LKFQAPESLIGVNGAFYLVEKKQKEREGEKERAPGELNSVHRAYNVMGPTIRGASHVSQVHTSFSF
jgi:hypothetical protein